MSYMKKIFAKVVADLFHPGHVEFFRRARELGGHLTVCVVPDQRVSDNKGKTPILSTEERVSVVAGCKYVDAVITDGPKVISPEYMQRKGFDIYAFGAADQEELEAKLKDCKDLPDAMKAIIPYTEGISSSQIIQRILSKGGIESFGAATKTTN